MGEMGIALLPPVEYSAWTTFIRPVQRSTRGKLPLRLKATRCNGAAPPLGTAKAASPCACLACPDPTILG